MKKEHFECKFCHTKFVREHRYLNHRCKEMERDEKFRTPEGQAAWSYYQKWMKAYRRMAPSPQSFLSSRYFQCFMRFTEHTRKVNLPDVDCFIRLMKEKDISPTIWVNDQVYGMYLEYLDRKSPPSQQARITIDTLFDLSEKYNCEVGEVFENLSANEVLDLLRKRQFSPWLLTFSKKFKNFILNETTTEQRIIMEQIIRPGYWQYKFQKYPKEVEAMRQYVKELGI